MAWLEIGGKTSVWEWHTNLVYRPLVPHPWKNKFTQSAQKWATSVRFGRKQKHFYFQWSALWSTSKCRSEPWLWLHTAGEARILVTFGEVGDAAESHQHLLWQSPHLLRCWGAILFFAVNHWIYFKFYFCWWRSGGFRMKKGPGWGM